MEESVTRRIALPWYSRGAYAEIVAMMADPHNFAPTYDQWLLAAENNELVAQQSGIEIMRVMVEPGAFAQWCTEKGVVPGSAARAGYVSERCFSGTGEP